MEKYGALLDHLGFAHGVIVQGNAHGYDNRVVRDALERFPQRFRGIAIRVSVMAMPRKRCGKRSSASRTTRLS